MNAFIKNSTFCKSSHKLIVAEKPSVAQSISKALGITKRRTGYLEGGNYLVSWCVGHLVELAPPGSYDSKLVKWSRADLPILPKTWQYLVSPGTQKQFEVLRSLMARPDVDRLICATDAGREGELNARHTRPATATRTCNTKKGGNAALYIFLI